MAESTNQLSQFRQWIHEQQPILRSLDTDEFLLRFLRVTDFDLHHAKEWLIRFWKYRTENPPWSVDVFSSLQIVTHLILSLVGLPIVIC